MLSSILMTCPNHYIPCQVSSVDDVNTTTFNLLNCFVGLQQLIEDFTDCYWLFAVPSPFLWKTTITSAGSLGIPWLGFQLEGLYLKNVVTTLWQSAWPGLVSLVSFPLLVCRNGQVILLKCQVKSKCLLLWKVHMVKYFRNILSGTWPFRCKGFNLARIVMVSKKLGIN